MSFVQNINGKFEKITEASWYKILMPKLYGWGAAIVILGALFYTIAIFFYLLMNNKFQAE